MIPFTKPCYNRSRLGRQDSPGYVNDPKSTLCRLCVQHKKYKTVIPSHTESYQLTVEVPVARRCGYSFLEHNKGFSLVPLCHVSLQRFWLLFLLVAHWSALASCCPSILLSDLSLRKKHLVIIHLSDHFSISCSQFKTIAGISNF